MGKPLLESLGDERLDLHKPTIAKLGYLALEDHSTQRVKLHDLYDWTRDTWFECKTDQSHFFERMLIEYKANVPPELLDGWPLESPMPHDYLLETIQTLPANYDALAIDNQNLEPLHLLSYRFLQNEKHYILDIRELRAQIASHEYQWIIFESPEPGKCWRSIAQIVPLEDCTFKLHT